MEMINSFIKVSQSCIINQLAVSGINLEWDMDDGIVMVDVSIATSGSESYGYRLHILKFDKDNRPDGDMLIENLYKEEHLASITSFVYDTIMSGEMLGSKKSLLEVTEDWVIKSGTKDKLVEVIKQACGI